MRGGVIPIILSGGAGTRLWPLSTEDQPKQFVDLFGSSLFDRALHRLDGVSELGRDIVVTGESHRWSVEDALAESGIGATIISEPVGRNTAPAVLSAALICKPDEVLVVLPSDHLIADGDAFAGNVEAAVREARKGKLVTFGVRPTRPETGFGYIEIGDATGDAYGIATFHEKPDPEEAQSFVADGRHLWNSGMFTFTAEPVLDEAELHVPGLLEGVRRALPGDAIPGERRDHVLLKSSFADIESISNDHAIMERTGRGVVIPIDVRS